MQDESTRRIAALSPAKRELLDRLLSPGPAAESKELVAYLVPREDGTPGEAELRAYLRQRLPEYMVPSAFVMLDTLPRMPSGKLDLTALPAPSLRAGGRREVTAPRTERERWLAGIWAEVLGLEAVGVEEDFFALGGHSLAAIQVVSRLRERGGVELPVSALFESPTVAELARRLEALGGGGDVQQAPSLARLPREQPLPLSFAQQRLWFLDQLQPGNAAYHLPAALRLSGPLKISALEQALEEIVRRHEVLRTTFPAEAGQPLQVIHTPRPWPLPVVEVTGDGLEARIQQEAQRPFDLARGPLMRTELLRLGRDEHVLLCTLHHIVADGWSVGVLVRELSQLYRAFVTGQTPSLPELPIQYADHALWQRRGLSGEALETRLGAWKRRLAGAPVALELPTDRPRPAVQRFLGRRLPLALSRQTTGRLHALCQRENVTPFMALLAALSTLLARYTRQRDILVGTPVANRDRVESEGLIGLFANTLVLRTDLSGEPSVRELLRRVRASTLEDYGHQDVPFEKIVDALGLQRELSRTPLFQVMLVLENEPVGRLELPGLTVEDLPVEGTSAKFDLTVTLAESPEGLRGSVEYNTDLFDAPTVERMAEHLRRLVEGMVEDPAASVFHLPMLSEAERRFLLEECNPTRAFSDTPCLHQLFEAQAARRPEAVALSFEGRHLTYAQLNARANRLARHLRTLGAGPGQKVALCLERSWELVVAVLATLKSGAAYVPVEPSNPPERIAFVLEDCDAPVMITQRALASKVTGSRARVLLLEDLEAVLEAESAENLSGSSAAGDLAYVIYTSGSTGRPKGVLVDHGHVVRLMNATQPWFHFDEGDVWTLFHSAAFDFSVWELWGPLVHGGRLVVVPYWMSRSPEDFYRLLCDEQVTVLNQTPSAFRPLIQAEGVLGASERLRLRYVIFGGEALELQALRPWFERHGDERPRLVNMYGITETIVHVTYRVITRADLDGGAASVIGVPIPDLQVHLLDEYLQLVPVGVAGEIHVGGAGVARGYLNRPELTAMRFVPDPFRAAPGARLYRSGDLARRLADGDLDYLGRIDQQVKIRGFRIELGEIEAVLTQHPGVREVAVLTHRPAQGEPRLVAYLVARSGTAPGVAELRGFLKERLPEYMVPALFVMLDALPLTGNGKLDRRALPSPEGASGLEERPHVAARDEREQALVKVWAQLLRREQVGIHDNFFELGGDSLLAIQMVALARREGWEVSPRQLFQHQTIAELAAVMGSRSTLVAEQGLVVGPVPLTPVQRWFFEQPLAVPEHWNQALALRVLRPLEPSGVERAVRALLAHHDALRLRFHCVEGRWTQSSTAPDESVPFQQEDLSSHPEPLRALEALGTRMQSSLELSQGPLFRVALVRLGEALGTRLVLVAHHLVVDAVSWRLLLEDLNTACEQLAKGEPIQLPAKTTSFKEWSERLTRYASSPELARERAWWSALPWNEAQPLVVDTAGERTEGGVRSVEVRLDEASTQALLHQVPEAYRTQVEDVLLAALGQTFGRRMGLRRVLVELEGHGREAPFDGVDVSRTVGWFTSLYPLLLDGRTERGEAEVLKSTKEQLRQIPHRGFGQGVLRYLSAPDESSWAPEPEVSFNYLGQLDRALPGSAPFALASEEVGPSRAPGNTRRFLLDVTARIVDRELELSWAYGEGTHRRETIEALARTWLEQVQALIAHCLSPDAGGCTPSDFPLARLEQASLDRLTGQRRDVEDLYPLSPMQQGFWLYGQYSAGSVGVEQVGFTLHGPLRPEVFERAWQTVIDRHPVLRTAFVSEGLSQPLQLVRRRAKLSLAWQDLRGLSTEQQRSRIDAQMAEDLGHGFKLDTPPLMRLAVLRLAEDVHQVLWSHHHLLMDGWSLPLVLREVTSAYEALLHGRPLEMSRPRPFRDYIAWHQSLELEAVGDYWRRELAGLRAPTALGVDRSPEPGRQPGHHEEELRLSAEETGAIEAFARGHQLSLGSLLQAAWARVLGRYSGEREVVFGSTVSGRPSELEGVESMVGLFINVVPVRVRLPPEQPLMDWLRAHHTRQLEQRQYEHAPLLQIQQWSEVPAHLPLFESLLVVENYPTRLPELQEGGGQQVAHGLALREVVAPVRTRYRLTLIAVPGARLSLHATWEDQHFAPDSIRRLLGHLRAVLAHFLASPARRLGEVSILPDSERAWLEARSPTERLVDADHEPVPVGIPGEVCLAAGLVPTDRVARCLPGGAWESLGQRGDALVLGGQRVFPAELTAHVASAPDLREAFVRAHPGEPSLVAYVVPEPGTVLNRRGLAEFLHARLMAALVPRAFVPLSELPRTAGGAVDVSRLPEPGPEDLSSLREQVAPRTRTEQGLAHIWSELMGGQGISVLDDFFELGGQSLLAVRMLSRVRALMGVELPIHVVFAERTLERIARWMDSRSVEGSRNPFERSPLKRLAAREAYALSPYQLPEWYFSQLAPDSPMYNILSCDILLEGELDLEVLTRAWQLLVDRHGVFRTFFGWEDGRPVQRILPSLKVAREDLYLDYTDTPEDRFIEVSTQLAHDYAGTTFDFSRAPLFRLKFAEFPGKRFLLMFLTNHVLWDEVSSINMVSELKEAYNALLEGRPPELPVLEVDYVDYAHWVNQGVASGLFERERQYWLERFRDMPAPLELPTDFPRPPHPTFQGSDVEGRLPRETRQRLDAFVQQHPGVTFSMVLHATFALLLHRLSGQDDLVIGVPVANRGDQRLEPVIGPFATAMPMRSRMSGHMRFSELLEQLRRDTVEALEHYAYPSVLAIQELNPRWDVSRGRLFQVMYGLQHNKTKFWNGLRLGDMRTHRMGHLSDIGPLHSTARADLRLIVEELGDEVLFSLSYSADLFKRSTAARMARQYLDLLDEVARRPHTPLADFSLLTPGERTRVLESFNDTREELPIDSSLGRRIEEQVERTPDAPAVVFEGRTWTYGELDAEANRWAHHLAELGIELEDRVGLLFEPTPEMIIALLAVLKTGAAYVPLHPEQPSARWDGILELAGARVLLTHAEVNTSEMTFEGTRLNLVPGALGRGPTRPLGREVPPRAGAVVFFTSGSTGVPKGIEVEHRGVLNLLESTQRLYGLRPGEATLLTTPYTFDPSMLDLFWPLVVGARLVVPRGMEGKTPSRIAQLVDAQGVTFLQCVPLMLAALVEGKEAGEVSAMPSLRAVMCAGSALPRELYERCVKTFAFHLANHYGPTEASVDASRFDPREGFTTEVVPIGRPVSNTRLYVLDERLEPAPLGVTGELFIAGVGLARGYLGDPEKTARAFLPDPFVREPGERMYRTGDLAHFDEDGVVHFIGRVDRQVKVRGNRVEIEEIETRLTAHPAVRACVVQHKKGAHEDFLVAWLELREQANALRTGEQPLRLFTLAQRPELKRAMDAVHVGAWPDYFAGDEVQQRYWPRLASEWAHTQLALVDARDQVVAVGNALPLCWDGTVEGLPRGWDGGLEQGFRDAEARRVPDTLLVLAGVVAQDQAGQGLSAYILRAFKALARSMGLARVLVPVRPTGKVDHPELGFEEWCDQRRPDGLTADPWLRVHDRLGGRRLKADLRSQHVRAPLARWEEWSGQRLDTSGERYLKGTLQPVRIDVEQGVGEYFDPSLWVEHPLDVGPVDALDLVDARGLREFLRGSLPEYMVPEHFRFLRELPRTTSGKVSEKALPEFQLSGHARPRSRPPQTPLQLQLAEVFARQLGLEAVGLQDDFFELGGNSLKAIQLLARVDTQFGVKLLPREFFKQPTVEGLEHALGTTAPHDVRKH